MHGWRALLFIALAPGGALATDYVNDPLTAPGSPGLGVRGGSFSASGWTTSAPDDTLWWVINDALVIGSVSFDLTGVALCQANCSGDNDLMTVYQAPTGVPEPIAYSPYYRNNDLRAFIRMFSTGTADPANGAIKLELVGCMVGSPYFNNTCPADCTGTDAIAYCGGRISDCGWDPTHTYHFELNWGGGTMTYLRDGATLGSVGYPSTFAPQPLVVHLGSPRNAQVGGSSMPIGVTFANVKISGTSGTQTPVCDATQPPDAGVVVNPCTAGEIGATQDITAASWVSGVFPDPGDLNVEADGSGNPNAVVYVMLPPAGGPVTQATLTLHTLTEASAHGGSGQVCLVPNQSWSESNLTWATRPATSTLCSGNARTVDPDQEVSWDVTSLLNASGGPASLALVSADPDGVHYYSKESGGCALGPRLVLTLAPPQADAGTVTTRPDAGGSDADGGRMGQGPDSGTRPPGAGDGGSQVEREIGSCGCAGSSAGGSLFLWALLLPLASLRRRSAH